MVPLPNICYPKICNIPLCNQNWAPSHLVWCSNDFSQLHIEILLHSAQRGWKPGGLERSAIPESDFWGRQSSQSSGTNSNICIAEIEKGVGMKMKNYPRAGGESWGQGSHSPPTGQRW